MTTYRIPTNVLVARANQITSVQVLRDHFNYRLPEIDPASSWKIDCPFSFEHGDGGMDKNCRVYGTGSLYCFAQHGQLSATRLFSLKHDLSTRDAAWAVLEAYSLARPRPYRERYAELVAERESKQPRVGQAQEIVDALHLAASNHPCYATRQYSPKFMAAMAKELARLDAIAAQVSPERLTVVLPMWYAKARAVVLAALDEGDRDETGVR